MIANDIQKIKVEKQLATLKKGMLTISNTGYCDKVPEDVYSAQVVVLSTACLNLQSELDDYSQRINQDDLVFDPLRSIYIVNLPIRARRDGISKACDLGQLTRDSLLRWMLSNDLIPTNTVLALLGHDRITIDEYNIYKQL